MNNINNVLRDFVATYNDPKSNGDMNKIIPLFPELKDYDPNVLLDYVASYNDPKSNGDFDVINSKFPEFFPVQDADSSPAKDKSPLTPFYVDKPKSQVDIISERFRAEPEKYDPEALKSTQNVTAPTTEYDQEINILESDTNRLIQNIESLTPEQLKYAQPIQERLNENQQKLNQLKASKEISETGQLEYVGASIASGKEKLNDQYKARLEAIKKRGLGSPDNINDERQVKYLDTAYKLYDDAEKILNAPSTKDPNVFGKFAKGTGKTLSDSDFWSMGVTDMVTNTRLSRAAEKLEKGEKISAEEEIMLDAAANKIYAQYVRMYDTSAAYRGGAGLIESLGFMAEMAATGGLVKGAASVGGKALSKILGTRIMNALGKTLNIAQQSAAGQAITTAAGTRVGGLVGTGVKRTVEAAASSAIAPSAIAGTTQRMAGEVDYVETEDGIKFKDMTGQQDLLPSYLESWEDTFKEFLSERGGGSFSVLGKALRTIPGVEKRMVDFAKSSLGKGFRYLNSNPYLKQAGWHGFLGEWNEELDVALYDTVFKGGDLQKDFFNKDTQSVLLWTLVPMSAFSAGMNGVTGYKMKRDYQKSNVMMDDTLSKSGMTPDEIRKAKSSILNATSETMNQTITEIMSEIPDATYDVDGVTYLNKTIAEPLFKYAKDAARYNAFNNGLENKKKELAEEIESLEGDEKYDALMTEIHRQSSDGYKSLAPGELQMKKKTADNLINSTIKDQDTARRTKEILSGKSQTISPDQFMRSVANDPNVTPEELNAISEFYVASLMEMRRRVDVDTNIRNAENNAAIIVQSQVNPDMNMIATTKIGEETITISRNKIALNEDGTVDQLNTDDTVYGTRTIRNEDGTESTETIPIPKSQLNEVKLIDPAVAMQESVQRAREAVINEMENQDSTEHEAGETVRIQFPTGIAPGTIVARNEAGYIVNTLGGEVVVEPRMIINETQLLGVDVGARVRYMNGSEVMEGVVDDMAGRVDGAISIDNTIVPIESVLGKVDENAIIPDKTIPTATAIETAAEGEATKTTETTPGKEATQDAGQDAQPQIPVTKDGSVNFDAITTPEVMALAAEKEFGSEAFKVISDEIAYEQVELEKAQKIARPTERAVAVKKSQNKINLLTNTVAILQPKEESAQSDIRTTQETEIDQVRQEVDEAPVQSRDEAWERDAASKLPATPYTLDSLSEMLETGEYAMFTAENPNNVPASEEQNAANNERLEAWLKENNKVFYPIIGKYDGKYEKSYLILNISKNDAIELAKIFDQREVAHSTGMYNQNGEYYQRVYGVPTLVDSDDFYSVIMLEDGFNAKIAIEYNWDIKLRNIKTEDYGTEAQKRIFSNGEWSTADGELITTDGQKGAGGVGFVKGSPGIAVDRFILSGKEYEAVRNTDHFVFYEDNGVKKKIHKSKILVQSEPVIDENTIDLQVVNNDVDLINDAMLVEEVYFTARNLNTELKEEEAIALAAAVKSYVADGDSRILPVIIQEIVEKFGFGKAQGLIVDRPAIAMDADGSVVTTPNETYNAAVSRNPNQTGNNLWVRQSDSKSNTDRTVMIQISSTLSPSKRSRPERYFDKLYRMLPGYDRSVDFWEVPTWMGRISAINDKTDVCVVRSIEEAQRFIQEAKYGNVLFSAMDAVKMDIKAIVDANPEQTFEIGVYTPFRELEGYNNVTTFKTVEEYAEKHGLEYKYTYNYANFAGTSSIPRIRTSEGCRYKCAFCSNVLKVSSMDRKSIMDQVDGLKDLDMRYVYVGDKAFGQADNREIMFEVYERIKAYNPNFEGFIVQTAAADFANERRFTPEYIKRAHIAYVELGVETVNDDILAKLNKKHSSRRFVDKALDNARKNGVKIIPNLIVGLSGKNADGSMWSETRDTYMNTINWLKENQDVISHINVYALALYEGTELGDEIGAKIEADRNENIVEKSFMVDPQVHAWAMNEIITIGNDMLERQADPAKALADTYISRLQKLKESNPAKYWSVDMPSKEVIMEAAQEGRIVDVNGGMGIVTKSGNMVGLFKYVDSAKGTARSVQEARVATGGNRLDVYDVNGMVEDYAKTGFREVARIPFNEKYAPDDMPAEARDAQPDVVFMIYDPENTVPVNKSRVFKSYDAAKDFTYSLVKKHPNRSANTQAFFSDVVSGKSEKFKPLAPWAPILDFSDAERKFKENFDRFNGNFDIHIATSIPGFRDTQIKTGSAVLNLFGDKGGLIYDIGGSEGGWVKAITSASNGRVQSINLDPNPDMNAVFDRTPVEGSVFVPEAFYEGFDDYKAHTPKQKADVVHESMTFQFISNERRDFVKEVKDKYIKPGGIFLTEEKLMPDSMEQFLANEEMKDTNFKSKYYTTEQLRTKAEEVLVGMTKDLAKKQEYIEILQENFAYVYEYWDSGNFKGYIATDNKQAADQFMAEVGNTDTMFAEKNILVRGVEAAPSLPEFIEVNGVMRPTTNSNGLPIHKTEEGVRNFYEWFGDSKVVDEQGRPLVVYHGTTRDFDEFKTGYFAFTSTNPEVANLAAGNQRGSVMPLYVKLENPMEVDAKGAGWQSIQVDGKKMDTVDVSRLAMQSGNDGVIISNIDEYGFIGNNVVANASSQIKSATGNSGAFSTETGNIDAQIKPSLGTDGNLRDDFHEHMTDDGQGNYVFFHYGEFEGNIIDSSKGKRHAYTSDARAATSTNYYTKPTDRESMINGRGFFVKVPKHQVYPFTQDPNNYYDEALKMFRESPFGSMGQAFSFGMQASFITKIAMREGYKMIVSHWNDTGIRLKAETLLPMEGTPIEEFKSTEGVRMRFEPVSTSALNDLIDRLEMTGLGKVASKNEFKEMLGKIMDGSVARQTVNEMQSIKDEAIANGTFMKAPNGRPTNLNENQWLQVRTKAFKEWFGDWETGDASKAVDANGEPMVMFRGHDKGIPVTNTRLSIPTFTPIREIAESYAEFRTEGTISEMFISIKNPHMLGGEDGAISFAQVQEILDPEAMKDLIFQVDGEFFTYDQIVESGSSDALIDAFKVADNEAYKKWLLDNGYDGSVMYGPFFEGEGDVYTVEYRPVLATQAKSAINNTGAFDKNNPDVMLQVVSVSDNYTSSLEDAINTLKQSKGTPEQMKAMLLKNGAKPAEMEFMGWDDFVVDKTTITREQIEQWFDENQIELVEIENRAVTEPEIESFLNDEAGQGMTREEAIEYLNLDTDNARYEEYTLEGGENYREILVHMPNRDLFRLNFYVRMNPETEVMALYDKEGEHIIDSDMKDMYPAERFFRSMLGLSNSMTPFTHSHWPDVNNVVAHLRVSERMVRDPKAPLKLGSDHVPNFDTDFELIDKGDSYAVKAKNRSEEFFNKYSKSIMSDNNMDEQGLKDYLMKSSPLRNLHSDFKSKTPARQRVLFVEEMQSDWSQKGREVGYSEASKGEFNEAVRSISVATKDKATAIAKLRSMGLDPKMTGRGLNDFGSHSFLMNTNEEYLRLSTVVDNTRNSKEYDDAVSRMDEISNEYAAFLSWYKKASVTVEMEIGKLGRAAAPLVEKYFMSSKLPATPFKKTDQWATLVARRAIKYAAENGISKISWTTGQQQADRYPGLVRSIDTIRGARLSDGYELVAEKDGNVVISKSGMSDSDLRSSFGAEIADMIISNKSSLIQIDNLNATVGGEGMKGFYDNIVPKIFRNVGKKYGAKISQIEKYQEGTDPAIEGNMMMDIPSEMMEDYRGSIPMFMKIKGDVYGFAYKGKVYLNPERMNANTPIHEFGHLWVDMIQQNNRELYERGYNLIVDTPYYDAVKADPNYKHLSEDRIRKEAMAMAIGHRGEEIFSNKVIRPGLWNSVKNWISDVWVSIGGFFGIENLTPERISTLTFREFTDIAIAELLSGKDLTKGKKMEDAMFADVQAEKPEIPVNKHFKHDYYKHNQEFLDNETAGKITKKKTLSDFNGSRMIVIKPDNMFSGSIYYKGKEIVKGGGGIYFAARHLNDGHVWSSTAGAATGFVNTVNKAAEEAAKRGETTVKIAVVSGEDTKLTSNAVTVQGALDLIINASIDVLKVSKKDLKRALQVAAKTQYVEKTKKVNKKTGEVTIIEKLLGFGTALPSRMSIEEMRNALVDQASDAIFDDNKAFVKALAEQFMTIIGDDINNINLLSYFLSAANYFGKQATIARTYKLSAASIVNALSIAMTEPTLIGINQQYANGKTGVMYAVIEVDINQDNPANTVKSNPDFGKHIAYPVSIDLFDMDKQGFKVHILGQRASWTEIFKHPTMDIAIRESGEEVNIMPTIRGTTSQALEIIDQEPVDPSDIDFQLVGPTIAENLDKIEQVDTRMKKYELARQMQSFGYNYKDIWTSTGWELGKDGKWRYEIDDWNISEKDVMDALIQIADEGGMAPIYLLMSPGNIEWMDKMRKASKSIRTLRIGVDSDPNAKYDMGYAQNVNAIIVPERAVRAYELATESEKTAIFNKIKSDLIHEIQHSIQYEEGFGQGSSAEPSEIVSYIEKQMKKDILLLSTYNKAKLLLDSGISRLQAQSKKGDVDQRLIDGVDKQKDIIIQMLSQFAKDNDIPLDIKSFYIRSHGEAESRNVQRRAEMTQEQRRLESPRMTSDVDYDQLIVNRHDANLSMNYSIILDDAGEPNTKAAREKLAKQNASVWGKLVEGHQNNIRPVLFFQKMLQSLGAKISDQDNYYMQYTATGSKIQFQVQQFEKTLFVPLKEAINKLAKFGYKYDDVIAYAQLKHADEYTDAMNAKRGKNFEDLAGKKAIEDRIGMEADEYIKMVEDMVPAEIIKELWNRIRAVSDFSLNNAVRSGELTTEKREEIRSMFEYYVPLRGYREKTAEELYEYNGHHGQMFSPTLKKAKGRTSEAADPFSYLMQMAISSIHSAENNILLQTWLRMSFKDKTGLLSVGKQWMLKSKNAEGKTIVTPAEEVELKEGESIEEYNKRVADFEADMQELKKDGKAFRSGEERIDLGVFIKPANARKHEVAVWRNGVNYTIRFNTDPRVPEAINGNNMRNYEGAWGGLLNKMGDVTRFMAAAKTMYRPAFIFITNPLRDMYQSFNMNFIDQGAEFTAKFATNVPRAVSSLVKYYTKGIDPISNPSDRLLWDYMSGGAKTGKIQMLEINDIEKKLRREVKMLGKGKVANLGNGIWDLFQKIYQSAGDITENQFRFATYITAIETGYSKEKAIQMAKDVTLNFDRHGSGRNIAKELRSMKAFYNVGWQALDNLYTKASRDKYTAMRASGVVFGNIALGYFLLTSLNSMIAAAIGEDDDEWIDLYSKVPEFTRNSNLMLYTGKDNGFISVPISQELRIFYGLGSDFFMYQNGKVEATKAAANLLTGLSSMISYNPVEQLAEDNLPQLAPDVIQGMVEISANKNFLGSRIYDTWKDEQPIPGYQKVRTNRKGEPYAPEVLIHWLKEIDKATGGDGVVPGKISANPDIVNHLMGSYLAGLYTQFIGLTNTIHSEDPAGEILSPPRSLWRPSKNIQEKPANLGDFYEIKDKVGDIKKWYKKYEEQYGKGELDEPTFRSKIDEIGYNNDLQIIDAMIKTIDKYNPIIKEIEGDEQKKLINEVDDLKRKVIEIWGDK